MGQNKIKFNLFLNFQWKYYNFCKLYADLYHFYSPNFNRKIKKFIFWYLFKG